MEAKTNVGSDAVCISINNCGMSYHTVPCYPSKLAACNIVNSIIVHKERTGLIPSLNQIVSSGCPNKLTVSESLIKFVDMVFCDFPTNYDIDGNTTLLYSAVYQKATSCIDRLIDLVKKDTNMYTLCSDGTIAEA